MNGRRKRTLLVSAWALAVIVAASQWYLYDALHHHAERPLYYLATCAYLCGVLTPVVWWLGRQSIPIHIAASLLLTGLGVFLEATLGWLPHAGTWAYSAALRHYFLQHTQISLVTYWVLFGTFYVYRMYDQARLRELHAAKLEAQLAEAQLTVLRTQLQPHFLFNTLQAATTLIYDDPQGAEEILLSLSELLRISLQALEQQEIPLRSEIEFVRHYAAIQQRRFGDRLGFDFQIEEEAQSCAVPSLLLQPLVENAIRHGVGARKRPDVVSVRALVRQDQLRIEVQNRAGTLDSSLENLLPRGVGLSNTIARLERLYGSAQTFDIRNLSPQGVMVALSIPMRSLPLPLDELETQAIG